jgi:hypothetical protein
MLKNDDEAIIAFLNSPVMPLKGKYSGNLFGVELEVEGRGVAMEGIPSRNWKRVEEGSLRGENIEYVFSTPCEYDAAVKRVNKLFETFKENGVQLNNSYRTSTHVHLNFSDKTVKQVILFFFLHTILEELLEVYCGEHRKGNLFCMSTRDNENLVVSLEQAIFAFRNFRDFGENIRYCAANLAALNKFGTIEIRTMRGADTAEQVNTWLNILNQLYEYALNTEQTPVEIVEQLSFRGAAGFLSMIFDEETVRELLKAWPAAMMLHVSLLNGVRLLQMLAYKLEPLWTKKYEAPVIMKNEKKRLELAPYAPHPNIKEKQRRLQAGEEGFECPSACDLDGQFWWMFNLHQNRQDKIVDTFVKYDDVDLCWKTEEGVPIRYAVFRSRVVEYGSVYDLTVNHYYYEYHDLIEEHPAYEPEDDYIEDAYDEDEE